MKFLSDQSTRTLFGVALVTAFTCKAFAQAAGNFSAPVRDTAAATIIEASLTAMGGRDAIGNIKDSSARVDMLDPSGSGTVLGTCRWKNRLPYGFRYQCPNHAVTSHGRSGRPEREGQGAKILSPQVVATDFPAHLVAYKLFQQASDRRTEMIDKGTASVDGIIVRQIELVSSGSSRLRKITRREWYFNAQTNLPVEVEIPVTLNGGIATITHQKLRWADFHLIQGVAVPFSIETYIDSGPPVMVAAVKEATFNEGIMESDLEEGGR